MCLLLTLCMLFITEDDAVTVFAAGMFINPILAFWGMSEELPCIYTPWSQQWFDWCFVQAFKRHKDFIAVFEIIAEPVVIAEPACCT